MHMYVNTYEYIDTCMYTHNVNIPARDNWLMPGVSLFLLGFNNIWPSSNVFPSFWISFPRRSVFSLWLKEMLAGRSAKHLEAFWHSVVTPGVYPFLVSQLYGGQERPTMAFLEGRMAVSQAWDWTLRQECQATISPCIQDRLDWPHRERGNLPALTEFPSLMLSFTCQEPLKIYKEIYILDLKSRSLKCEQVLNL